MTDPIVGFTCSCFDLLHAGHILMLREAKELCQKLVVGLQTDPTIDRPYKNAPIQSLMDRYEQLDAVKYVDQILLYETEDELYNMIKKLNPSIRFVGTDWKDKPFTGHDLPIEIHYTKRHGHSTSKLRKDVWGAENAKFN